MTEAVAGCLVPFSFPFPSTLLLCRPSPLLRSLYERLDPPLYEVHLLFIEFVGGANGVGQGAWPQYGCGRNGLSSRHRRHQLRRRSRSRSGSSNDASICLLASAKALGLWARGGDPFTDPYHAAGDSPAPGGCAPDAGADGTDAPGCGRPDGGADAPAPAPANANANANASRGFPCPLLLLAPASNVPPSRGLPFPVSRSPPLLPLLVPPPDERLSHEAPASRPEPGQRQSRQSRAGSPPGGRPRAGLGGINASPPPAVGPSRQAPRPGDSPSPQRVGVEVRVDDTFLLLGHCYLQQLLLLLLLLLLLRAFGGGDILAVNRVLAAVAAAVAIPGTGQCEVVIGDALLEALPNARPRTAPAARSAPAAAQLAPPRPGPAFPGAAAQPHHTCFGGGRDQRALAWAWAWAWAAPPCSHREGQAATDASRPFPLPLPSLPRLPAEGLRLHHRLRLRQRIRPGGCSLRSQRQRQRIRRRGSQRRSSRRCQWARRPPACDGGAAVDGGEGRGGPGRRREESREERDVGGRPRPRPTSGQGGAGSTGRGAHMRARPVSRVLVS